MKYLAVLVAFTAATVVVAAEDVVLDAAALDESFTIFLDLSDYHVGKDGSHEFLTSDHIGEHDNVIVHMSEDEMRMHMAHHDTHDCEPPAAQHEIVSFVQEAMWERPAQPNFIDDAINANYMQNSLGTWDSQPQMGVPALNNPFANMQVGQPQMGNLFGNIQAPVPAAVPKATQPTANKPMSAEKKVEKKVAKKEQAKPQVVDEDEEAAVARFRDAYHAHKYSEKEATEKVLSSSKGDSKAGLVADEAKKAASLFDTLFDADDKAAMGMFGGDRADLPEGAFDTQDFSMGNVLDKIVDDALGKDNAAITTLDPEPSAESKEHHHKHHKHHDAKDDVSESAVVAGEKPQPSESAATDDGDVDLSKLSTDEQQTLKTLMKKLSSGGNNDKKVAAAETAATNTENQQEPSTASEKAPEKKADVEEKKADVEQKRADLEEKKVEKEADGKVKQFDSKDNKADSEEVKEAVAADEAKMDSKKADVDVKDDAIKADAKKSELKVDTLQKSIVEEEEEQAVKLAPSGDLMTTELSHISAAPMSKDFIPESVYAQQAVSFDEKPQLMQKHVPKRILIPRMEEPGPVIGGGSRPVHIMLPPPDSESGVRKVGSSRPAPPVQAQIRAAFPPSAITNTAGNTASANDPPSSKVTTLATANDEALSAAEVIIF